MTTPGGQLTPGDDSNPPVYGVPEGAYVGDAGSPNAVQQLSYMTEASAKEQMQVPVIPSFTAQRDAAWGVFGDIAYALTGIEVDQYGNPIDVIADWALLDGKNLGEVISDYGNDLDALGRDRVVPWAVPTVAPLSQTINRRADPTFQLSDFLVPPMGGIDSRGDTVTTDASGAQAGANVKGRIFYAFLTPTVTRAYTQLNFLVSAVTNPCQMDVAIYLVDESRTMTRQVHKVDAAAGLGLGEAVVSVTFDTFVAEQGSYLAIAWLQRGTGNPRSLLGLNDTPRPIPNAIFPRKISAASVSTGKASLPVTVDGTSATEVDFIGHWFTPYAELSEDIGIDYRSFTERWGHGGTAPRPWVSLTNPGVYSSDNGYVRARTAGFGYSVSMYDTPLSTDFTRVRSSVHTLWNTNFRRSTLVFRGSNDLRTGVGLSVINLESGNGRYEVISWSGRAVDSDWDNRTVLATLNVTPKEGHTIEIDFLGGDLIVRINGVVRLDATGLDAFAGSAYRFVGVQAERTGSVFLSFVSPFFGAWSARDLPQDEPEDPGEEPDE